MRRWLLGLEPVISGALFCRQFKDREIMRALLTLVDKTKSLDDQIQQDLEERRNMLNQHF
jgi:hypothetical protein